MKQNVRQEIYNDPPIDLELRIQYPMSQMKGYLVLMCCLLLVGCNNSPDKDINSEELDMEEIVMEQEDQLNENIDFEESDLESNVLYAALDEDEYRFSHIGSSKQIIEHGDREIQLLKVRFLAEDQGEERYVPTINFTLKNIGKKELSYSVEDFRFGVVL